MTDHFILLSETAQTMTTMDSDSESQDSDDGRRFRFETTRKDANVRPLSNARALEESPRTSGADVDTHRDRRDRTRHECRREYRSPKDRDYDDSKYSTKYNREMKNPRYEDKNSESNASKHTTRDTRHHRDRDRSDHRKRRSEERSYDRSQNGRASADRHKSKSHDKHKHRSHERTRDRGRYSEKSKSSEHKSRNEHDKKESHKTSVTKDTVDQRPTSCGALSNSEHVGQDNEESCGMLKDSKTNTLLESQTCEDVNLSEFDVISETDENLSDNSDVQNHKSTVLKRSSKTECDRKRTPDLDECHKVNAKKNGSMCGSSDNNTSTVSDSLLGSTSPLISATAVGDDSDRCKFKLGVGVSTESLNDSDAYGPILPSQSTSQSSDMPKKSQTAAFIGPCLPPTITQKSIHPHEKNLSEDQNEIEKNSDNEADDDGAFGPALPPHLREKINQDSSAPSKIIGPTLPESFKLSHEPETNKKDEDDNNDEDGFGPLPADHPALKNNYVYAQLEYRARRIRDEHQDEEHDKSHQREEWMTELPPAQATNLGLGPRKFRMREGPDMSDRSCWTDTPTQKAEKQKQKELERQFPTVTRREPTEEPTISEAEQSRKRQQSLLDMHQKKLKKKKKKEEKEAKLAGHSTRRPFDRDIDLKANQFDQAQKKSILLKAKLLDDRFSRGQL